jgi:hypothetical protein
MSGIIFHSNQFSFEYISKSTHLDIIETNDYELLSEHHKKTLYRSVGT